MDSNGAVTSLSALGHDGRLAIFRLLIRAGQEGVTAGEIARRLGVLSNTLSANLTVLSNARLIRSRRDGRFIVYSANYDAMRDLLSFLMDDCCQGVPEICAPLTEFLARAACCPAPATLEQAP